MGSELKKNRCCLSKPKMSRSTATAIGGIIVAGTIVSVILLCSLNAIPPL